MSEITITNLHKSYHLNKNFIKGLILKVLKLLKKLEDTELEVVFLTDTAIKALNKKYKSRNRATDVLSFRLDQKEIGSRVFIGEIFISLDTALSNSKVYKAGFPEEVIRYVIHGILHLFGYDDETLAGRSRMSAKEDRILKSLCEKENLSKVLMPL